jgi:hypothetical protein
MSKKQMYDLRLAAPQENTLSTTKKKIMLNRISKYSKNLNCRFNFILMNDLKILVPDLYFKPSAYTAVLFTGKRKNYKHLILNTSAIMQCNNSHVIILIIIINPYMTRGLALGQKKRAAVTTSGNFF